MESQDFSQVNELQKDTEQLRQLITNVKNSGINAWKAGDLLKKVKDDKNYTTKYKTFENYTYVEFGISPQTANDYIKIRNKFTINEIGRITLLRHLVIIADIENDEICKQTLKAFQEVSTVKTHNEDIIKKLRIELAKLKAKQYIELRERLDNEKDIPENTEISTENANEKLAIENIKQRIDNESTKRIDYKATEEDVVAFTEIIKGEKDTTTDDIKRIIEIILQKSAEQKRKRTNRENVDNFGKRLHSEYFKETQLLIENEPYDEMGLVSMFCIMFPELREIEFQLKTDIIKFSSIKYIRSKFPDCCIRIEVKDRKKSNREIQVEFEFESYNFIKHKH